MARLLLLGDPALAPRAELAHAVARIAAYVPADDARAAEQAAERDRTLAFCAAHSDALHRTCLAGHLTASAIVLDAAGERGLFTLHRKLGKWLQLGGHCDGDANLPAVALREATEESGLAGLAVDPTVIRVDVHGIPAHAGVPAHLHLDTSFVVRAPTNAADARTSVSDESRALAWLTHAEALARGVEENVLWMFARALRAAAPGRMRG
jgi:8-oxo-dGTP pyrophosphatase MutT (NUDIX family)